MERTKQQSVNGDFDEEYNQLKQKLYIMGRESNPEKTRMLVGDVKY